MSSSAWMLMRREAHFAPVTARFGPAFAARPEMLEVAVVLVA
jgi:hypothetical protein